MENVAVVGASQKEDKYSHMAVKLLEEKGHNPIPVAPAQKEILGRKVYSELCDVPNKIDTVTMYVGAARQSAILEDILKVMPRRVIFNPGAENPDEYDRIRGSGIEVMEACTLVLLKTEQF